MAFVSQEDLEELQGLQDAMDYTAAERDALRDRILQQLRDGAQVEEGLRVVRIKEDLEIL